MLAVDGVGNQTFSANRVIMLDVDAPTVAIGGVATGDSVSGPVALSATASDTGGSGVASVQYGYRTDGSAVPYTAIGGPARDPAVRPLVRNHRCRRRSVRDPGAGKRRGGKHDA